jgi:hypothetical protein
MHLPVMRRHCHSEGNQGSRAGPDQKKRAGRWHRYWMKIKINIPSSAGTGCHPASPGIPSRASAVSDGPRRPRAGSPRTSPAAGCSPQISSDLCCSRDGMDVAGEEEHRGGAEEPSANAIPSTEGESEGGGFRIHGARRKAMEPRYGVAAVADTPWLSAIFFFACPWASS